MTVDIVGQSGTEGSTAPCRSHVRDFKAVIADVSMMMANMMHYFPCLPTSLREFSFDAIYPQSIASSIKFVFV